MPANGAPDAVGGADTAIERDLFGEHIRAVQCPVDGLILGLAGGGGEDQLVRNKLALVIDHICNGGAEVAGYQTVQDHLCNGLLAFFAFASGLHIDELGKELGLVVGQLQAVVTGLHIGPHRLFIDKGIVAHLAGIEDERAIVAPADLIGSEAVLKPVIQPPTLAVVGGGVVDLDLAVLIEALQQNEVLAVGEEGPAVHQLDDDLSLPQGLLHIVVILRLGHGQLQGLRHIADTVRIVFGLAAKPFCQLVGVILVPRQVSGHHGHAAHAAPVVFNGSGAIHNIGIVIQGVVREEALDFSGLGNVRGLRLGGLFGRLFGNAGGLFRDLLCVVCPIRHNEKRQRLQKQQQRQHCRKNPGHPAACIHLKKDAHSASKSLPSAQNGKGKIFRKTRALYHGRPAISTNVTKN
jgi:hypothetical protein